jgi:hypothetical protein
VIHLTSSTSGGHSVGVVRQWTKATEFICLYVLSYYNMFWPYKAIIMHMFSFETVSLHVTLCINC